MSSAGGLSAAAATAPGVITTVEARQLPDRRTRWQGGPKRVSGIARRLHQGRLKSMVLPDIRPRIWTEGVGNRRQSDLGD